ncbi:MAG: NAD(P)-binding domain-containing protein [Bacteroidia bacterium]|nr:NAD(P)-binding domain-containing protein [Bacteroidia bacterium]
MNIAVFGTGMVAQTIGPAFAAQGHTVVYGTRNPAETLARSEAGPFGAPPFAEWFKTQPDARLVPFAGAAEGAELIVNATSGQGSLPALESAGAQRLEGKILIDIANPLDFSNGFPPSLSVCNTDSLGEQIQRAFPGLKVVKTLNTLTAALMVNPAALPADHVIFMSGDNAEAKTRVASLLQEAFGWKAQNIINLGDITTARGTEMVLPLWVRLYASLQTPMFNFGIVRQSEAP